MFNIVSTKALSTEVGSQWKTLDASEMILSALFSDYRRFIVTIYDDIKDITMNVDFEQFRSQNSWYSNTLNLFIQELDPNTVFLTVDALPETRVGYVQYNHLVSAGYHFNLGKAGIVYPEGTPADLLTDICLTRPEVETDFEALKNYCLASVNGFLHRLDYDGVYAYIKEGGRSVRIANNAQLGLYSFRDISRIECLNITDDMISIPSGFSTLEERVQITLPADYSFKSFLVVIGGYLYLPHPQSCWVNSEKTLNLDMTKVNLLDKVFTSRSLIDLSSLNLTVSSSSEDAINVEELFSDEVLRKYLTLPQSFIIFLDTDNMFYNYINVRQSSLPGRFSTKTEPKYPLMFAEGRLAEYWKQKEDDTWGILFTESFYRLYMYRREQVKKLQNVDSRLDFEKSYFLSSGRLLELGSYLNQE